MTGVFCLIVLIQALIIMCMLEDSSEDADFHEENYLLSCQFEKKKKERGHAYEVWVVEQFSFHLSAAIKHHQNTD